MPKSVVLAQGASFPGVEDSKESPTYQLVYNGDGIYPTITIELTPNTRTAYANIQTALLNTPPLAQVSFDKKSFTKESFGLVMSDSVTILKFFHLARLEVEFLKANGKIKNLPLSEDGVAAIAEAEKNIYKMSKANHNPYDSSSQWPGIHAWAEKQITVSQQSIEDFHYKDFDFMRSGFSASGLNAARLEQIVVEVRNDQSSGLSKEFLTGFSAFICKKIHQMGVTNKAYPSLQQMGETNKAYPSLQILNEIRENPYAIHGITIPAVKKLLDDITLENDKYFSILSHYSPLYVAKNAVLQEEKSEQIIPPQPLTITKAMNAIDMYLGLKPEEKKEDGTPSTHSSVPVHLSLFARLFSPNVGHDKAQAYKELLHNVAPNDLSKNIILYALLVNAGPTLKKSVSAAILGIPITADDKEFEKATGVIKERIEKQIAPKQMTFEDVMKLVNQINEYANAGHETPAQKSLFDNVRDELGKMASGQLRLG